MPTKLPPTWTEQQALPGPRQLVLKICLSFSALSFKMKIQSLLLAAGEGILGDGLESLGLYRCGWMGHADVSK